MHMYQKQILDLLREQESMRYSALQPLGVESSHFKYHLNQLIKDGHVEKVGRGVYSLTTDGQRYVDTLSTGKITPHESPKLITYTLLYDDEHYYFYKKPKLPYKDLLNMCGGRHHVGETAQQASSREIHEKTGLNIDDQAYVGTVEVVITKDDLVFTHFVASLFTKRVDQPPPKLQAVKKANIAQSTDLLAPEQPELLEMIAASDVNPLVQISL